MDGVHDDPHRFALLEALISFASTTRAAVCAEGVETLEDLAVLAGDGRDLRAGLGAGAPGGAVGGARAAGRGGRDGGGPDRHARPARAADADGAPTLGDLIARLTPVSAADDIAECAAMIPAVLGAEDAAVSRVVPGEHCVEDISRHGWSQPGARYSLDDYPATEWVLRTRTAGQVVVGDPASDPAEVELIERDGFGACSWSRSCSAAATSACSSSTAATRCRGAARRSSARSCSRTSSRRSSTCSSGSAAARD